ncbi:MAG: sulfatase-like hydrolase/transferase, partial [Chloroflexi bacterium]|nr:sulfatase-like hydrolase/transferase [Chloroflexota bacterium]
MAVAATFIRTAAPALPSTPRRGRPRVLRRLRSFLEATPRYAAAVFRTLAAITALGRVLGPCRRQISARQSGQNGAPPRLKSFLEKTLTCAKALLPTSAAERVEPHAPERYRQALPAHGTPRMSQDQSRPNVLLIITDQQRGDCLGIDGHPVLQTPAMDWLGASGTFFRRGYSESPSCIPARRVLMSGRPPDEDGMVGFMRAPWDPPPPQAGELRAAGSETRIVGNVHL